MSSQAEEAGRLLPAGIHEVLAESRSRGFLGPGPLETHVERALGMLCLFPAETTHVLDLGSGGGLPGLPLSLVTPSVSWLLLDGSVRRCDFLRWAVSELSVGDHVAVLAERAEAAGRTDLRGTFDAVLSRSFGPSAVTAECAAPFLRPGGRLIVSEPPESSPGRWPAEGLALLGLVPGDAAGGFQVLEQVQACPARFPRRTGVPAKRPLWR